MEQQSSHVLFVVGRSMFKKGGSVISKSIQFMDKCVAGLMEQFLPLSGFIISVFVALKGQ